MDNNNKITEFSNLIKLIMEYYSFSTNKSAYSSFGIDTDLQEFLEDKPTEHKREKDSPIPEDLGIEIEIAFKNQIKNYQ